MVLRLALDLVTMDWAFGVEAHKVLGQRSAPSEGVGAGHRKSNQGPCLSHACQAAMVEEALLRQLMRLLQRTEWQKRSFCAATHYTIIYIYIHIYICYMYMYTCYTYIHFLSLALDKSGYTYIHI